MKLQRKRREIEEKERRKGGERSEEKVRKKERRQGQRGSGKREKR